MAKRNRKEFKGGSAHDRAVAASKDRAMPEPPVGPPTVAKVANIEGPQSPQSSIPEKFLTFAENPLILAVVGIAGPLMAQQSNWFLLLTAACFAGALHREGVVRGRPWPRQVLSYTLAVLSGAAAGLGIHVASQKQETEWISTLKAALKPPKQPAPPGTASTVPLPGPATPKEVIPPDFSVQLVGVSSEMPPQSGRSYKVDYEIAGGISVRSVRGIARGYYVPTSEPLPETISKFYRAFTTSLKTTKLPEVPELSGKFSQPVPFGGPISPSRPVTILIITYISWVGPSGISGEIKTCRTSQQSSYNAAPEWNICQISEPTPADSRLEAMSWQGLITADQAMAAKVEEQKKEFDAESQNLHDIALRSGSPFTALAKSDDELEKRWNSKFSELCPELGPLVEESAFRVSYEYEAAFIHRAKQGLQTPGNLPPQDQAHDGEDAVDEIALRCQSPKGTDYTPPLDDTAFALRALSDALEESIQRQFPAPFDSRPFGR